MALLLTILRLTAFLLSAAGYVAVARAYWKITPRASYIFVFSAQALIIYFAGLAGILSYAAYTLFGGGIVLLVALILNKKIKLAYNTSSLTAINLAFVAAFGAITASLVDTFFVHYDNFSHWAVVVKYMLITDRFPDAFWSSTPNSSWSSPRPAANSNRRTTSGIRDSFKRSQLPSRPPKRAAATSRCVGRRHNESTFR